MFNFLILGKSIFPPKKFYNIDYWSTTKASLVSCFVLRASLDLRHLTIAGSHSCHRKWFRILKTIPFLILISFDNAGNRFSFIWQRGKWRQGWDPYWRKARSIFRSKSHCKLQSNGIRISPTTNVASLARSKVFVSRLWWEYIKDVSCWRHFSNIYKYYYENVLSNNNLWCYWIR